ncbi:acid phosphatase [Leptolinea sp. HRD-7]|nr:acid phosphatase [Leptolinea sp. HRD-7]
MIPLDSQYNLILQNLSGNGNSLNVFMELMSFIGSVVFLTLLVAVVYWCIDTRLGLRLGISLFITNNLYSIFKLALHSPRPYWVDSKVKALSTESSFGFPSGHANMSSAIYGYLGINTRKRQWITGALLLIFLIGFSRVYLGVHFISDVLGGWVLGFVLIGLMFNLDKPVTDWVKRENSFVVFIVTALLGIVFIASGYFFYAQLTPWQMPIGWVTQSASTIHPVTMKDVVDSAGIWIGFAAGACWLRVLTGHEGKFDISGNISRLIWRCLLGIAGILLIYGSLGLITPHSDSVVALVVRFIRSGLTGFWLSGLAPFVFHKTGLAVIKKA